eukprot:7610250-Alexandrium_andersonii.AAC.1
MRMRPWTEASLMRLVPRRPGSSDRTGVSGPFHRGYPFLQATPSFPSAHDFALTRARRASAAWRRAAGPWRPSPGVCL